MNIKKYASQPAPGQLTERQAKQTAHAAGLSDLTLNMHGVWIAFDYETGEQPYVTPELAQQYGIEVEPIANPAQCKWECRWIAVDEEGNRKTGRFYFNEACNLQLINRLHRFYPYHSLIGWKWSAIAA